MNSMSDTSTVEPIKVVAATVPNSPSGSESFFLINVTQVDDTTITGTVDNVLAFTGFSWGDTVQATLPTGAQTRPYISQVTHRADRINILLGMIDEEGRMPEDDDPRSASVDTALKELYTGLSAHEGVLAERWMHDLLVVSIPETDQEKMVNFLAEVMHTSGATATASAQNLKIVFDVTCSPNDPTGVDLPQPPGYAAEANKTPEITDIAIVKRVLEEHPWKQWFDDLVKEGFASAKISWPDVHTSLINLLATDKRALAAVERGDGQSLTVVAVRFTSMQAGHPLGPFPDWMNY
jgi:hypothetical protein